MSVSPNSQKHLKTQLLVSFNEIFRGLKNIKTRRLSCSGKKINQNKYGEPRVEGEIVNAGRHNVNSRAENNSLGGVSTYFKLFVVV